jgi:NAD dependent epimerase/dehydratase family enzyme
VLRLVRGATDAPDSVHWDPGHVTPLTALDGVDAVVHLAGESIASGRWTPERKRRIHESRATGTRVLADALAALPNPPRVLVSASAIGIYGDRGDAILDETSAAGRRIPRRRVPRVGGRDGAARGRRHARRPSSLRCDPHADGWCARQMLPPFRVGLGWPRRLGRAVRQLDRHRRPGRRDPSRDRSRRARRRR